LRETPRDAGRHDESGGDFGERIRRETDNPLFVCNRRSLRVTSEPGHLALHETRGQFPQPTSHRRAELGFTVAAGENLGFECCDPSD
jgi:hypothetical protein